MKNFHRMMQICGELQRLLDSQEKEVKALALQCAELRHQIQLEQKKQFGVSWTDDWTPEEMLKRDG